MPTVLRESGYQVIIFTSDHPPPHVHVRHAGKLAKITLVPVEFDRTGGFNPAEQNRILALVRENQTFLLSEWHRIHPPEENKNGE